MQKKLSKYWTGSFVLVKGIKYKIICVYSIGLTKERIFILIDNQGRKLKIDVRKKDIFVD